MIDWNIFIWRRVSPHPVCCVSIIGKLINRQVKRGRGSLTSGSLRACFESYFAYDDGPVLTYMFHTLYYMYILVGILLIDFIWGGFRYSNRMYGRFCFIKKKEKNLFIFVDKLSLFEKCKYVHRLDCCI